MTVLGAAPPSWDLLFLLPHLNIPRPSPFDGRVVRLLAGDDPVLTDLLRDNLANTTGRRMLAAFRGQYGQVYVPGCLILDSNAPGAAKTADALRAFRNACATATILPAYADGPFQPRFSDHFDIYPLAPARDGAIVTNDAIVRGLNEPDNFVGQCSPLIQTPWNFTCQPNRRLLARLTDAWRACFLARRRRRSLPRLFRALEVVAHACRFPTDSLMSVHDAGLRLVLWVSAFEALLHPAGQRVNLTTVLGVIRSLPWRDPRLTRKSYRLNNRDLRRVLPRITLPEAVYDDLYKARNDFAHGNRVPRQGLRLRRSPQGGRLLELSPLLFRAVLEHQLDIWLPRRGDPQPPPNASFRWLLTKAGQRYMRARVAHWGERPDTEAALIVTARRR